MIVVTGAVQQEPRRDVLVQDGHLECPVAGPVRALAGDDHLPVPGRRQHAGHRGRVRGVIEDQQPARSSLQPLPGCFRCNILIWLILLRQVQQVCNACEVGGQYLAGSGIYPQNSRVVVTIAIRIFDSYLRLAASIKTTDYLWLC